MFRAYMIAVFLVALTGLAYVLQADGSLLLGAGLALLTTGAGGLSAGCMSGMDDT